MTSLETRKSKLAPVILVLILAIGSTTAWFLRNTEGGKEASTAHAESLSSFRTQEPRCERLIESAKFVTAPQEGAGHFRAPECQKVVCSDIDGSFVVPFKVGDLPEVVTFVPANPAAVGWPERIIVEHCLDLPQPQPTVDPASYQRTLD